MSANRKGSQSRESSLLLCEGFPEPLLVVKVIVHVPFFHMLAQMSNL